MKYKFIVGQKVVFIGVPGKPSIWSKWPAHYKKLEKGKVYTIRELRADPFNPDLIGLLSQEVINPPVWCHGFFLELAVTAEEFRPVEDTKTDISIFTKLLGPSPVQTHKEKETIS